MLILTPPGIWQFNARPSARHCSPRAPLFILRPALILSAPQPGAGRSEMAALFSRALRTALGAALVFAGAFLLSFKNAAAQTTTGLLTPPPRNGLPTATTSPPAIATAP